ncbi:ERF family protein [Nocardiaceae bacterium NPDC056970]
MKVWEALSNVMADVGAVGKDQRNQSQKFNFRGIDDVVNAVSPALRAHGVVVLPHVVTTDYAEITSGGGKRQAWVKLTVEYRFVGPEGDELHAVVASEATDFADKATAKAMSVAFRIALLQVLALPTDDPDPDAEYNERDNPPTEADNLRGDLFALCESKGIAPTEVAEQFKSIGGKGRVSECQDVAQLTELFDMFKGA